MTNPYLDIVIRMKDEASDTLHKFSSNATSASQGFAKAFLGATVVAGAAAVGFGKVAFEAYAEAESSQAQLEHAVIGVSKATKEQLAATMALSDELERKGVLDGDNIKVGLAQLSTFGLSNKAVQGLGGSLADLAVNQFGTAASGEQLSQSANMIAKALNGQFGVLEKSGIRFTDAQKKMIEYGTEADKVKAINEGFAQNLKATNETMRETSEGRLAHMKVQMENVKEGIGELIAKAIGPIIEKISAWIDKMGGAEGIMEKLRAKVKETSEWIQEHKTILLIVAGAIAGPLVLAFVSWAAAALSAAVGTLIALAPVLLIGAAVMALILAFKALVAHWDEIKGFFDNLFNKINGFFDGIKAKAKEGVEKFKEDWRVGIDAIKGFFGSLWDKVKDVADKIKNVFNGIWDAIKNAFKALINSQIRGINVIINGINKLPGVNIPNIPLLAKGGPVRPGMPYIVGDGGGPELFVPRSAGQVIPNDKLGGGNITVIIQGDAVIDNERRIYELATKISETLGRQNRQALNGGY